MDVRRDILDDAAEGRSTFFREPVEVRSEQLAIDVEMQSVEILLDTLRPYRAVPYPVCRGDRLDRPICRDLPARASGLGGTGRIVYEGYGVGDAPNGTDVSDLERRVTSPQSMIAR
ncbi:hypothetical protein MMSR116_18390 [Methylobacterium mesophilicum SR1.6/6]|uniref:Uncharacterized protein n=1 Tax=Methylobacterium mesophilicum SR1.6/6 TaxID=908290 RepID=A0A6B9FM39_9HYPH|nr:hypothetical protein [Methylobacterium mesophilicum]QGY03640.1 hypothetical protein MMSR116_18390 [Methylobacterium mesophilicum SR1.6/6]